MRNRIKDAPLDLAACIAEVTRAEAGAVATFCGVVRNVADGRPVTRLEYHAYLSMAETEMQKVLDEIVHDHPEVRASAEHRVGALDVGDVAMVCAVSAPHRGEAFEACRRLVDRVKERVPIWKREHGAGGPYWVGWR